MYACSITYFLLSQCLPLFWPSDKPKQEQNSSLTAEPFHVIAQHRGLWFLQAQWNSMQSGVLSGSFLRGVEFRPAGTLKWISANGRRRPDNHVKLETRLKLETRRSRTPTSVDGGVGADTVKCQRRCDIEMSVQRVVDGHAAFPMDFKARQGRRHFPFSFSFLFTHDQQAGDAFLSFSFHIFNYFDE
jgi:hypothetical protein